MGGGECHFVERDERGFGDVGEGGLGDKTGTMGDDVRWVLLMKSEGR